MDIRIRGARENNLKSVDVDIGDGFTVITGISGSGKSSRESLGSGNTRHIQK